MDYCDLTNLKAQKDKREKMIYLFIRWDKSKKEKEKKNIFSRQKVIN